MAAQRGGPAADLAATTLDMMEHFMALDDWEGFTAWCERTPDLALPLPHDLENLATLYQRLQQMLPLLQARREMVAMWITQLDQSQTRATQLACAYGLDDESWLA